MKPFTIHRILAPTDLSELTVPALRCARLFADRFSATLTVMYSDPLIYASDFASPAAIPFTDLGEEHLQRLRNEVREYAEAAIPGRTFAIDVGLGEPAAAILATARETKADLLVVGTHLRHGWRRALIGSVSESVLHASGCPVLTVASHDGTARPLERGIENILCPVNFTDVAAESLHVAAGVAAAFHAHLTVVHVVESEDAVVFARVEERVRRWIEPELQHVCAYRELVVRGGPAERVLDCAEDLGADLLVIGAQQKRFRDTTVIGETAERLIRFASPPVLVVPRPMLRQTAPLFEDAELLVASGR